MSSASYEKRAAGWGIRRSVSARCTYSELVKVSKAIDLVGIPSILTFFGARGATEAAAVAG